ncbi:hypothetical protein VTL71DRAFT_1148 [Oculimacula yallundae]|uniref:HTH APSES-type domain-containing protein n=1 Tax=Oculimacula yallundae TaxID=86028 RepID=A0ABR4D290_9HELO
MPSIDSVLPPDKSSGAGLEPFQYTPQNAYDPQTSSKSALSQRSESRAESSVTSYNELQSFSRPVTGYTADSTLDFGNAKQASLETAIDMTGQAAPPGGKPRVTATVWEDEGVLCFQVDVKGVCVARREDNNMINGTKLLNVTGMTRGRRDGILKAEKAKHVVKIGPMHLRGVWIPYERALFFANSEKTTDLMYPLFVHDIGALLYHPTNQTRTSTMTVAAEGRKLEEKGDPGSPAQSMQQYQQSSYTSLLSNDYISRKPDNNLDGLSPVHTMKDIRQIVLDRLEATKTISDIRKLHDRPTNPKRASLDCEQLGNTQVKTEASYTSVHRGRAKFRVLWEAKDFLEEQFGFSNKYSLGSVITLTGTGRYAQAITVEQYLRLNWPDTGLNTLKLIEKLIVVGWDNKKMLARHDGYDGGIFFYNGKRHLTVEVEDTHDVVVEIAQQLAWLGCVLRSSKNGKVGRTQVRFRTRRFSASARFELTFEAGSIPTTEDCCWHDLFVNPSIAYNFPIPSRGGELGLEISVPMMAALGGASRAIEFEGGLLIKGFSSAFVPLAKSGDSIQWHYIRNEDGSRLSYPEAVKRCPGRALLDTIDQDALTSSRAFLGWWDETTTHLGTADVNYDNLDWSPTRECRRSTNFSGGSIGFQNFGTGEINFSVGPKDSKLHISRTGSYEKIVDYASITPTVLYDSVECRGWLVPASAVIAHIVQKSHARKPFRVAGKRIDITPVDPTSDVFEGARHMLLANAKIMLRGSEDAPSEFCFEHAVLDIWTLLECIMDRDVKRETSAEIEVGMPLSKTLRGWEFMDLVVERSPLRQKEADIKSTSGNWIDLAADINAIVLFASGFEDVIRPAEDSTNGICHSWKQVPKGMDYLVAGVSMLNSLYEQAGSRLTKEHLTSTHIQWSRGPMLFEKCQHDGQFRCTCDRLQTLVSKSRFLTVKSPGPLSEHGAVIFGQQAKHSISHNRLDLGKDKKKEASLYSQRNTPLLVETGHGDPLCSKRPTDHDTSLLPSLVAEEIMSSSSDAESEDANGSSLGPTHEDSNMRTAKRGRENSDHTFQRHTKARRSSQVQDYVKKRMVDSRVTFKLLTPDDIAPLTGYSPGAQGLPQTHAIRRKPHLQQAESVFRRMV